VGEASEPLMPTHRALETSRHQDLSQTHRAMANARAISLDALRGAKTDRTKPICSQRVRKRWAVQNLSTDSSDELPSLRSFIDPKRSSSSTSPLKDAAAAARAAHESATASVASSNDGDGRTDGKTIPAAFAMIGCTLAAVDVAERLKKGPMWGQRWDRKQIVTHMLDNEVPMTAIKEARDVVNSQGSPTRREDIEQQPGHQPNNPNEQAHIKKYEMLPNGDLKEKVVGKYKFQGPFGPCPSLRSAVKTKNEKRMVDSFISRYRSGTGL